jgi:hypothetical protein
MAGMDAGRRQVCHARGEIGLRIPANETAFVVPIVWVLGNFPQDFSATLE